MLFDHSIDLHGNDYDIISKDLKTIYTAADEEAAGKQLEAVTANAIESLCKKVDNTNPKLGKVRGEFDIR